MQTLSFQGESESTYCKLYLQIPVFPTARSASRGRHAICAILPSLRASNTVLGSAAASAGMQSAVQSAGTQAVTLPVVRGPSLSAISSVLDFLCPRFSFFVFQQNKSFVERICCQNRTPPPARLRRGRCCSFFRGTLSPAASCARRSERRRCPPAYR